MDRPTRVVLAIDAPEVCDELAHALGRSGAAEVVATAADARQLAEATRQLEPELVIAEPRLAPARPAGLPCLTVASRESVAALRAAIDARADGFFVWPLEQDELLGRIRSAGAAPRVFERRAEVVAVHASRGGAGCTFLATHLAAAMIDAEVDCILIDADPDGDDVATVLGAPEDDDAVHPLHEIAAVADELTTDALVQTVWRHDSGVPTITASSDADRPSPDRTERVIEAAAAACDVVILHTGRGLDASTRRVLGCADRVLELVSLDVVAFRGSIRTMARLGVEQDDARWEIVVNRATRAEIVPSDVSRVFGRPAVAVVPSDAGVVRAQARGRLVTRRSRAGRAVARLAATIRADAAAREAA